MSGQRRKLNNLKIIRCSDRPLNFCRQRLTVDVAFVCDTYHHFEYPQSTLASIHEALKPGRTLIFIDFERIPGKSREFILNHVRADKEIFRGEIQSAGFELMNEIDIPGLEENYFLKVRRSAETPD